jgi:hypothetical protein
MLRLGCQVAGEDGWLFVFDGDDVVRAVPADLRGRLAASDCVSADVRSVEMRDPQQWPDMTRSCDIPMEWGGPRRLLYRALPGLRVAGTHWTYVADSADGGYRCLWGPKHLEQEPPLSVLDLVVEHRSHLRDKNRQRLAQTYYAIRDQLGIEAPSRVFMAGLDGEPVPVR